MQSSLYGPEHVALQDALKKFVDAEIAKWAKAVKDSGAKLD